MPMSDHNQGSESSRSSDSESNDEGSDDESGMLYAYRPSVLQAYTKLFFFLYPESLYNDGKGIQINTSLIGLLPRPKSGEKRRANAKPPVTTKVVYIHEKTKFLNGLVQIIGRTLKRRDLCRGGLDRDGNLDRTTSSLFSLEYTIPRTQLKDVEIFCEDDWVTFLEEAGKKPSAQGKLAIKEKLVSLNNSCIFSA